MTEEYYKQWNDDELAAQITRDASGPPDEPFSLELAKWEIRSGSRLGQLHSRWVGVMLPNECTPECPPGGHRVAYRYISEEEGIFYGQGRVRALHALLPPFRHRHEWISTQGKQAVERWLNNSQDALLDRDVGQATYRQAFRIIAHLRAIYRQKKSMELPM